MKQTPKKSFSGLTLVKNPNLTKRKSQQAFYNINRQYPHSLFLTVLLTNEHYSRTYCIHR